MKKLLILLLCLAPVLAGLPRLYSQRREAEHLRLAETMGLDPAPEGLQLSLAAPGGGEEEPLFASAPGASVNLAMEALRQQAGGEQLFCGHLQHILLGEAYARQGLESLLSAVCRSSDLRLDMPVYLILGAEAGEAMAALDDGKAGLCDALNSLGQRKNAGLSSAGRILRDLGEGANRDLVNAVSGLYPRKLILPLLCLLSASFLLFYLIGVLCASTERAQLVGSVLLLLMLLLGGALFPYRLLPAQIRFASASTIPYYVTRVFYAASLDRSLSELILILRPLLIALPVMGLLAALVRRIRRRL